MYYLRARYYDPTVGRFVTEDSYEGSVTNPLSLNLYSYCENDPVNSIDPTGHEKATFGEKWNALWSVGYTDATTIKNVADQSLELARQYAIDNSLNSVTDNIADGFRHFSWNYISVQRGVTPKNVSKVMTYHEVKNQVEVGKDKNKNQYYKVPLSSLMDLYNNKVGRYQATLKENKNKSSRGVYDKLVKKGAVITSLQQVPSVYGFNPDWIIPETEDSESCVIIKGNLQEDPKYIEVVDKNIVNSSKFKVKGSDY